MDVRTYITIMMLYFHILSLKYIIIEIFSFYLLNYLFRSNIGGL